MLRQLTSIQDQLRRAQRADSGVAAANGPALREIETTVKDLRQFRDSVLARPLPGLGYRQYPRLREEVQTVAA